MSEPGQPRTWRLTLPDSERVVGLDLPLAPPRRRCIRRVRIGEGLEEDRAWSCSDLVWNLPALRTQSAASPSRPCRRRPAGHAPRGGHAPTRADPRRRQTLRAAEAGSYALHCGEAEPAPGSRW